MSRIFIFGSTLVLASSFSIATSAQEPDPVTSLSRTDLKWTVPESGYQVLERGDVRAVIVDNRAVDDDVLSGHKEGYSGVASLTHKHESSNLFVHRYSGLNFEHIHDGTTQERDVLFEPRRDPMELRVIDEHTVELYQAPTRTWKLESATRYQLLEDGTIEMTFECIPRGETFRNGYIGLFWASYINQPESVDVFFRGVTQTDGDKKEANSPTWIRGVSPDHGVLATHVAIDDTRTFAHDDDFPLSLVFNRSKHKFAEPWFYGVRKDLAFVQVFRNADQVRLAQAPSGAGPGNSAWDFQTFIPDYKVGKRYQLVMRAACLPFESAEQIERETRTHREELQTK